MASTTDGQQQELEARPSTEGPAEGGPKVQTTSLPAAAPNTEVEMEKQDCSPAASDLSRSTVPFDFWEMNARNIDAEADEDWWSIVKHNPPRDATLAYTDWFLSHSYKDGCRCEQVQVCGKWVRWICKHHRYDPLK